MELAWSFYGTPLNQFKRNFYDFLVTLHFKFNAVGKISSPFCFSSACYVYDVLHSYHRRLYLRKGAAEYAWKMRYQQPILEFRN